MRAISLIAVSIPALACAVSLCGPARAQTEERLGPPYQAGGVWFVPAADPSYDQVGTAAEYGAGMDGRRTVSGERFDPRALTAAHATLPLPGVVEVTNLETHRTLRLRINDRGPYTPGRILSLTPASARALGIASGQSARVRVRYAEAPLRQAELAPRSAPILPAAPVAERFGGYGVQVGAFGERRRADQVAARASAAGATRVSPVERGGTTFYRVTVGPLPDVQAAQAARGALAELGFEAARVVPAA